MMLYNSSPIWIGLHFRSSLSFNLHLNVLIRLTWVPLLLVPRPGVPVWLWIRRLACRILVTLLSLTWSDSRIPLWRSSTSASGPPSPRPTRLSPCAGWPSCGRGCSGNVWRHPAIKDRLFKMTSYNFKVNVEYCGAWLFDLCKALGNSS